MNHLNPALVVEAGAGSPCGASILCCCIYYKRSLKCLGGAFYSLGGAFYNSPRALPLLQPLVCWSATDGSNCAETNVSQALIIYSVCCMLLSKVPSGIVSACIFNTIGPTGTMNFHHKPRLMPVFFFCLSSSTG